MKKAKLLIALLIVALYGVGCGPENSVDKHVAGETMSGTHVSTQSAINDKEEFLSLFKKFKKALSKQKH